MTSAKKAGRYPNSQMGLIYGKVNFVDRDMGEGRNGKRIKKRIRGSFELSVAASCCLPSDLIITVKPRETKKRAILAAQGDACSPQAGAVRPGPKLPPDRGMAAHAPTHSPGGETADRWTLGRAAEDGRRMLPDRPLATPNGVAQPALQRVQILDDMMEGQLFLLGPLGHAIDLFEGRDSADHLQHAIGVKR